MQEHAMDDHGYRRQWIINTSRTADGEYAMRFIWTMPDGTDWMRADWVSDED